MVRRNDKVGKRSDGHNRSVRFCCKVAKGRIDVKMWKRWSGAR